MVVLACIVSVVNGLFILAFLREMGRERSEERRVGEEGRSRGSADDYKKQKDVRMQ